MVFLVSLCILLMSLLIPPSTYYLWMRQKERQVWNLKRNYKYEPKISLIIATYNEAKVIKTKLENVYSLNYPEDKLEVIVVDSASTDGTLEVCREFLATHNIRFPTLLLSEEERRGKSHALNTALQYAKGEIIATSDADSFWEPDALCNAVSFFADSSVGAVTGRERLINLGKSIHTLSEGLYRKFYYTLRLGESKIHSTLIF
ncbi:MAG: glycosyltransferase, partial [Candidatus Jordarchaeaceae archaeon]